ncbi:type II secretion system protein E [Desulfamplus magnetovallimortis]|uniref:Type II secretion system protein E n=1 Tax=Desulfamplus magnetovallimortis TaxID=1246637 RepID=A0A1W1H4K5_9BACT|nr:GspE/PulE family protein [Desulfamplus magnetovallimortis]SLM27374.1 type II secretion system protein E [Desulfamplus magnetovallimortis]
MLALNLKRADKPAISIDEDILYETISTALGLPYKKIDPLKLDLNLVTKTIPKNFAMKHLMLPVGMDRGNLVVATSDPLNREAVTDIERATSLKVNLIVSSKSDIEKMIADFFGFKHSISAAEEQFSRKGVDLGNLEQYVHLSSSDDLPSTDQHIVNAVNHLFTYSFEQRASDIHVEPKRDTSIVRMRIDGVLHTVYELPKKVHNAVLSRIKTLSGLNMAEKRRPQDGRIKTEKEGVEVEIRVSTIPVAFGEKVVMRIMDPDVLFQKLEELGFEQDDFFKYKKMVQMPHGIILVTGPTGSGKSTTLYSTLRMLSSPEVNIVTIEDPIEMIHEDFNQIAVQPAIDVTFGTILRNILRQDPDIIMVGEIRDLQTAQSAVQAALTGHLVLSTLHTNDTLSTVTRLLDLGIPPFLIHSSLTGIIAQRLVRGICSNCIETFEIDVRKLHAMGFNIHNPPETGRVLLKRGKGCVYCRHTGYKGRKGVFEVLPYSEALKKMTTSDVSLSDLRMAAQQKGFISLRERAVAKMLRGETTYQEVLRVTWEQEY